MAEATEIPITHIIGKQNDKISFRGDRRVGHSRELSEQQEERRHGTNGLNRFNWTMQWQLRRFHCHQFENRRGIARSC